MKEFSAFIKHLEKLISIESVKNAPSENAPFGKEIRRALDEFLSIANDFDFETINYDGYAGEIRVGKGEEVGIIGHLDVVPAGSGWNTLPFALTEINDQYFGRGLCDDKAPLLLCLYALKQLKEEKVCFNKTVRLFVGCDEESSWQDVEYLKQKTTLPVYGFSPDGNFPVSYAEKGMAIIKIKIPALKNFYDISGGTVVNAVCGYASAKSKLPINENSAKEFGVVVKNDFLLESVGKSCHGSQPQLGINAIKKLFELFISQGENLQKEYEYLFNDGFGFSKMISEEGEITFSANVISSKNDYIELVCDCRFPHPFTFEQVLQKLNESGLNYKADLKHDVLFVEKESELVNALLSAYNDCTNDLGKPISQGGSTFARVFEKGVAFGPEFPNKPNSIHQPNENISKKDLLSLYNIYYTAIKNLIK